jgi:hypothetical protein
MLISLGEFLAQKSGSFRRRAFSVAFGDAGDVFAKLFQPLREPRARGVQRAADLAHAWSVARAAH